MGRRLPTPAPLQFAIISRRGSLPLRAEHRMTDHGMAVRWTIRLADATIILANALWPDVTRKPLGAPRRRRSHG
jgi:hypothetical protein